MTGRAAGAGLSPAKRLYRAARLAARRVSNAAHLLAARVGPLRVECPVCGGRYRQFRAHGRIRRPNARCPGCGSLERQRLLYLYLQKRTSFFTEPLRVLYFAPQPYIQRQLRSLPNLELVTADLSYPFVDVNLDIRRLPFRDRDFDVVLCNHVLEHVEDDSAAMREIRRVLAPGGFAVLMVPYDASREKTFEDASITDPRERERFFGQRDHVRIYGKDYAERLRAAGFHVHEDWIARAVDRWKYGLLDEPVRACFAPAVKATGSRVRRAPTRPLRRDVAPGLGAH